MKIFHIWENVGENCINCTIFALNPRDLVDSYTVGQSTSSAISTNENTNEGVDSDYNNVTFIVNVELEPCILEDSNNDNTIIHAD